MANQVSWSDVDQGLICMIIDMATSSDWMITFMLGGHGQYFKFTVYQPGSPKAYSADTVGGIERKISEIISHGF